MMDTPTPEPDDGLSGRLMNLFRVPKLTTRRMTIALVMAVIADGLQIALQPVPLVPEIIDVIAMALAIWALGFHILLLPTFVVELLPLVDMLPTWTGCVAAVIALRKRDERSVTMKDATVMSGDVLKSQPPDVETAVKPSHQVRDKDV
jgi:hypothetical protein